MRRLLAPLGLTTALLASGCYATRSSAVPTASARGLKPLPPGAVKVVAMQVPEGARELGIVEANGVGVAPLDAIVEELRHRVADLGGNFVKVDKVATRYETQQQMYSYQCGKSTCTGTRAVEVLTTSVQGRAYLTERTTP